MLTDNALLRQQLIVLRRCATRPKIRRHERGIMVVLARCTRAWRDALHLVQPDTLLRWHRDLFKIVWKCKSRPKGQPKRLPRETIDLIQKMAVANLTWGAERIRGELLKLGIRVSKRTIQKYIRQVRPPGHHGQTWETFIRNHTNDIWACDFLQLYDALFRPIVAFFLVKHGSREVVHFNVTRSPSDEWTAQQLREATPWGNGPSPGRQGWPARPPHPTGRADFPHPAVRTNSLTSPRELPIPGWRRRGLQRVQGSAIGAIGSGCGSSGSQNAQSPLVGRALTNPRPSWPKQFLPQQCTTPSASIPQPK